MEQPKIKPELPDIHKNPEITPQHDQPMPPAERPETYPKTDPQPMPNTPTEVPQTPTEVPPQTR